MRAQEEGRCRNHLGGDLCPPLLFTDPGYPAISPIPEVSALVEVRSEDRDRTVGCLRSLLVTLDVRTHLYSPT